MIPSNQQDESGNFAVLVVSLISLFFGIYTLVNAILSMNM